MSRWTINVVRPAKSIAHFVQSSSSDGKQLAPSTLSERLLFAVWLAGKTLGAQNGKQFAEEIGKGAPLLSRWITGEKRPNWDSLKTVADAVGISAIWLDDPTRPEAVEPPDFGQWLIARRARERRLREKTKRKRSG